MKSLPSGGLFYAYTCSKSHKNREIWSKYKGVFPKNDYLCGLKQRGNTMNNNRIIGRKYEQQLLESICEQREARMVAVYGRRRVGKTYLIKEFFHSEFDFMFTGSYETPMSVQLSFFQKELQKHTGKFQRRPVDWFEAFDQLQSYLGSLQKERLVVFFDELPWMDTPKSKFLTAFSYFWNTWASTRDGLKLFICGSSTSWMMNKVIGDKGGLYNRCSRTIYLSPFTLGEMEEQLQQKGIVWTRYQITEAYMIFGGIPYYIDMLDKNLTFAQNIDRLFFGQGAPLRTEYDFLFRSLFKDSTLARQVVEELVANGKGMTQQELKEALKQPSGGALTKVLKELQLCDFIRSYSSMGRKIKGMLYQLTDLFTLFHLRFVARHSSQDNQFWSNLDERIHDAWAGYAFERVCLHHVPQIKRKLGISGVLTNAYGWSTKPLVDEDGGEWEGAQIDLLLHRADDVINVCEIKYSKHEYVITEEYSKRLRTKMSTFRHHTKCRCALQLTFITTFGLAHNMYWGSVQSEVMMDDLFKMP